MDKDLQNALAWFASAPGRWLESRQQDLQAAAEWLWIVLQGDFAEEQTTAQTVTSTVISMIPLVDQLCDVRDVVANCRKINQDSSNKWAWFALALTLIGLFPTLGSLVKGCFKILFAYGRKAMFGAGKAALDADLWKASQPYVEWSIQKLNEFLARPEVRKTCAALKIDNIYHYLAEQLKALAGQLSVSKLTQAFDAAVRALNSLLDLVRKWGPPTLQTQAGQLLQAINRVRGQANAKLGEVLAPLQQWINRLAQRLDVEHRLHYQATTNSLNPHNFKRINVDAEIAALEKKKPKWVDDTGEMVHKQNRKTPSKVGWPDISENASRPLESAHKTFKDGGIKAVTYSPGTRLYRVLDPASNDNSICWMIESEFKKLHSKDDWRRRFAVWVNWNKNGEFVVYTVPPGKGLNAWEGVTASQQLKKSNYVLEGGAIQTVLDPKDLDRRFLGQRQYTGWGYDDLGARADLVGVPILQTNWRETTKK